MSSDLPKPPIGADVDLRDFRFMPLDVVQLQNSETWGIAEGWAAKAMVNLWCRAWHQVPAGSLPDNDALHRMWAGVPDWDSVREIALRGFKKCSDGRLYHKVVCEKAAEAWKERQRFRKAAKSRWKKKKPDNATHLQRTSDAYATHGDAQHATHMQGTGTGTGTGTGIDSPSLTTFAPSPDEPPDGDWLDALGDEASPDPEPDPEPEPPPPRPTSARGTRLPQDWHPGENDVTWALGEGFTEEEIDRETARFRDYWLDRTGQGATKLQWSPTWRNWMRKSADDRRQPRANGYAARPTGASPPGQAGGIVAAAARAEALLAADDERRGRTARDRNGGGSDPDGEG